jgi:hypothetical protein
LFGDFRGLGIVFDLGITDDEKPNPLPKMPPPVEGIPKGLLPLLFTTAAKGLTFEYAEKPPNDASKRKQYMNTRLA